MDQPIPDVTQDDVMRILRRDFSPSKVPLVEALLHELDPGLSPRIALAVLKLSDGGLDAFRNNLDTARQDWRDVIAYAEYPAYMSNVPGKEALSSDQRNEILRSDWEQYQAWLHQ